MNPICPEFRQEKNYLRKLYLANPQVTLLLQHVPVMSLAAYASLEDRRWSQGPFSQLVIKFPKTSDQEVTTDIIKYEKYYRKMEAISCVNVEAEHQVKSKMNLCFISSACRGWQSGLWSICQTWDGWREFNSSLQRSVSLLLNKDLSWMLWFQSQSMGNHSFYRPTQLAGALSLKAADSNLT